MSTRYSGGLLTRTPVTPAGPAGTGTASGIWTMDQALQYIKANVWPTQGVVISGQQAYTSPGTYSWIVPSGVTSVCVVCVGGAGSGNGTSWSSGGAGGGLGWKNNIAVTPGTSVTVVVGGSGSTSGSYDNLTIVNGGPSYFRSTSVVAGLGGQTASQPFSSVYQAAGGSYTGTGGGTGGAGGNYSSSYAGYQGGGGGAAGYTGNGGEGGSNISGSARYQYGADGAGGGGGGGGTNNNAAGGGGGVGILGAGTSGSGGYGYAAGIGGSGGTNGGPPGGGTYGGGGAANSGNGGVGAVRIIWGSNRSFPSTNTGNI